MPKSINSITIIAAAALVFVASFAGKRPPDPEKVERKLAAIRSAEQTLIAETVANDEARERWRGLLVERDRLVEAQTKTIAAYRAEMKRLNADYDATPEQFEEAMARYNEARVAWQKEMVDLITQMKAASTEDEWRKIARFELKKLDPRQLTYDPPGGGR